MTVRDYIEQISESNPGYVANWPPSNPITVGSVGTLGENGFDQLAYINDLQQLQSWSADLSQEESATIKTNKQTGMVEVDFSDSSGFVLQATDINNFAAANLVAVRTKILDNLSKIWKEDWYIVTGVQIAAVATILVSSGTGSAVELVGTLGDPLPLAGSANLVVTSPMPRAGSTLAYITSKCPVLMYRALKFTTWPLPCKLPDQINPAGLTNNMIASLPLMQVLTAAEVLSRYKG